jgi:hypothetical protein
MTLITGEFLTTGGKGNSQMLARFSPIFLVSNLKRKLKGIFLTCCTDIATPGDLSTAGIQLSMRTIRVLCKNFAPFSALVTTKEDAI